MGAVKNILVVDDDPFMVKGFSRTLRSIEPYWKFWGATSAAEGRTVLEGNDFDAVITDYNMPGEDGLTFLKTLKSNPTYETLPVIVVTGASQSDLKRKALELGATDLLTKPVDKEDLLARLRNVLLLKAYQDELINYNTLLESKVEERTAALSNSHLDLVFRLASVSEFRDARLGGHGLKVAHYSYAIAQAMGLAKERLEQIFFSAFLHDLGKIAIPEKILLKGVTLTFEEWESIRNHCQVGADLLESRELDLFPNILGLNLPTNKNQIEENPFLMATSKVAMNHHEWWNGKGYPRRISREEIPLEARIVSLADVYDETTSERPYKKAIDHDRALREIKLNNGIQFDPHVYAAFDGCVSEIISIFNHFQKKMS